MTQYTELAVGSFTDEPLDMQAAAVTGTQNPEDWFVNLIGGSLSDSGQRVDGYTALTSGPVWQAVTILGTSVMSLPVEVIQTTSAKPRRTKKRPDHIASRLLRDEPHPEFLPSAFKELLMGWAALHGNGIARIDRFGLSDPVQLTPLLPNTVKLSRDELGQLWYDWDPGGGKQVQPLMPRDVFHIRGPHGGLWGDSLIDYAKNSIGNFLALEKHGSSVFKNAARPSGILEKDGKMTSESRRTLREEWSQQHAGSDNAGNVAIVVDGIKWKPLSVTNEDAQWLEARRFSREEMASWFNLPAHMLNALENSSVRANLEEQNKAFYFFGLRPWLIRWQDEAMKKLFSDTEKKSGVFSVRFNANALVSADFETRMKGHATGRQWGWLSANDVLRLEDMDDIGDQGDKYMVPANMADAETGRAFGTSATADAETIERVALTLQKVYLAVGVVISSEEARDIVRASGFALPEGCPDDLCGIHPASPQTSQSNDIDDMPASEEDETPNTLNWLRPGLIAELTKVIRLE